MFPHPFTRQQRYICMIVGKKELVAGQLDHLFIRIACRGRLPYSSRTVIIVSDMVDLV